MNTSRLLTRGTCADLFRRLGVHRGATVMVHSSLKNIGYLVNGAEDIIDALRDVTGDEGTIVVPAFSGQLTDPAEWTNPPAPEEWHETIRAALKPFDPTTTPTRSVGLVAEALLRYPGARRSLHPVHSIAALGAKAEWYTSEHPLRAREGIHSPHHKLYLGNAWELMLGTGLKSCTLFHLAEFLADCPYVHDGPPARVLVEDKEGRRFEALTRYPGGTEGFEALWPTIETEGDGREIFLGSYRMLGFPARRAVDLAVERLRRNPRLFGKG